ncbi:hypothetical protein [Methylosinus sp. PW1]|uniref:hypothetical protein n=1 Tax=Methylosinus sp. PW1 TaxID=107636 RepID=UPI00056AFA8E|nr:hypothetical protein [Methylosinus sp. PW1]
MNVIKWIDDVVFSVVVAVGYLIAVVPMAIWPNYVSSLLLAPEAPRDRGYLVVPTLCDRLWSALILLPAGFAFVAVAVVGMGSDEAARRYLLIRKLAFGRMAEPAE